MELKIKEPYTSKWRIPKPNLSCDCCVMGECVYKDSFHGDFHEEETVQSHEAGGTPKCGLIMWRIVKNKMLSFLWWINVYCQIIIMTHTVFHEWMYTL